MLDRAGVRHVSWLEIVGLILLIVFLLIALFPNLFATRDPLAQNIMNRLSYPSTQHLFGTDELGRDIYARSIHGTRISVVTAFVAVMVSLSLGVSLGLLSGYVGGRLDGLLSRSNDILVSFPGIIIAMALIAITGQNMLAVALVIGIVNTTDVFRVTRATAFSVRDLPYVDAIRSAGAGNMYIMFRTILPNCSMEIFVQLLMIASRAIIIEASLSFLGLGTPPPHPTWGAMLSSSRAYLYQYPLYGIFPGLFIVLLVLSIQFVAKYVQGRKR